VGQDEQPCRAGDHDESEQRGGRPAQGRPQDLGPPGGDQRPRRTEPPNRLGSCGRRFGAAGLCGLDLAEQVIAQFVDQTAGLGKSGRYGPGDLVDEGLDRIAELDRVRVPAYGSRPVPRPPARGADGPSRTEPSVLTNSRQAPRLPWSAAMPSSVSA